MFGPMMLVAVVVGAVAGCTTEYRNEASTPITLCFRHNGDAPGTELNHTLAPGGVFSIACRASTAGNSWQTYFAARGAKCQWDSGCEPNTGTCKSYPWVMGQGVGTNGLWYGSIGANWDGAGVGFTGDYAKEHYGLNFRCSSYNGTQHPNLNCTVDGTGKPTCTPNKPNYGRPNSGVVECDTDQTLHVTVQDASCAATEYCCPDAKHCLTPTKMSCAANATVCPSGTTCCPLTKLCVTVGAPCTDPCPEANQYCCPDAKHCLTPTNPGVLCTGNGDCSNGDVCCPLTHECVKVGPACTP